MHIERASLPGIGVRYILTTSHGEHIGVICRPGGGRDLMLYATDDSERVERAIALTQDEAHHVADLLHATVTIDQHTVPEHQVAGPTVASLRITAGSPYDGRVIDDLQSDGRGAATVIAVLHDQQVIAGPSPSFVLGHGDTIIVAGHVDEIAALADRVGGVGRISSAATTSNNRATRKQR